MANPRNLPINIPASAITAPTCLHPGCRRKVAAGALCGYHARTPLGMTPVPTVAFHGPYATAASVRAAASKAGGATARKPPRKRVRPSVAQPITPIDRLNTATAMLLGAARDFAAGVPGAWERVEAARAAVAGATIALYEAHAVTEERDAEGRVVDTSTGAAAGTGTGTADGVAAGAPAKGVSPPAKAPGVAGAAVGAGVNARRAAAKG